MLDEVLRTIETRREQSLDGLKEFLRIPSVSTAPASKAEVEPTAGGKGHPVVLARNEHITGRPTVLLYGHYDVQPPEPLELWTTPAFEPVVRDGQLRARGAVDDKGQVYMHIKAI